MALAREIAASSHALLAGVECYEGLNLSGDSDADSRAVDSLMSGLRQIAVQCDAEGLFGVPEVILTAGGSAVFDLVARDIKLALSRPVPWKAEGAVGAGTVQLGVDVDGFVDHAADLSTGRIPQHPFCLFGQMTTADPTRSPAGTESAWAYTHVPRGSLERAAALEDHVDRMTAAIETVAPGFSDAVLARHVQSPVSLEGADSNLVGGAINAGTSGLHQELVFRPVTGLGRAETPIAGLYLASASAHPGGGVHGGPGGNAARAALAHDRLRRIVPWGGG